MIHVISERSAYRTLAKGGIVGHCAGVGDVSPLDLCSDRPEVRVALNHEMQTNRRSAAPFEAWSRFGSRFCARPDFPVAVTHRCRSASLAHGTAARRQQE